MGHNVGQDNVGYHIELFDTDFQPFDVIQQHQTACPATGAQSVFVGYMRDFREQNHVDKMFIDHYPPMTEKQLQSMAKQIVKQYGLLDLYVAHRVGNVVPTNPLVVIAATASHRTNAISAVSEMLEKLKYHAPFWKKEYKNSQANWVAANTDNKLK